MPKRGRPPVIATVVDKLEAAGDTAAADAVRTAANLPPRTLTPDEEFALTVAIQVDGGFPVGFNCESEADADHKVGVIRSMEAPSGRRYEVRRDGMRLEVRLVLADG